MTLWSGFNDEGYTKFGEVPVETGTNTNTIDSDVCVVIDLCDVLSLSESLSVDWIYGGKKMF